MAAKRNVGGALQLAYQQKHGSELGGICMAASGSGAAAWRRGGWRWRQKSNGANQLSKWLLRRLSAIENGLSS
jgi:hypothetical protein